MTDLKYLSTLREPSVEEPLRILFSACLLGQLCGVDGTSNGEYNHIVELSKNPKVHITSFCPEHYSFGTPRETPDIEGGTGADVLDGKARVITETNQDITEGMISAANKMVEIAQENQIELAIMMDVSGACGSQVIYNGHRFSSNSTYQIGMGVCAELLTRNGFKIVSQRDYKSLEIILKKLNPDHIINTEAKDHNEIDWYLNYFKKELE